jgi:hypothetical protein
MYFHIIQHGAPRVFIANRLALCVEVAYTLYVLPLQDIGARHNVHIHSSISNSFSITKSNLAPARARGIKSFNLCMSMLTSIRRAEE